MVNRRAWLAVAWLLSARTARAQPLGCETVSLSARLEPAQQQVWEKAVREARLEVREADPDFVATITLVHKQVEKPPDVFGGHSVTRRTTATVLLTVRDGSSVTRKGALEDALPEAFAELRDATGALQVEAEPPSAKIDVRDPVSRAGRGRLTIGCVARASRFSVIVSAVGFHTERRKLSPGPEVTTIRLKPVAPGSAAAPVVPSPSETSPSETSPSETSRGALARLGMAALAAAVTAVLVLVPVLVLVLRRRRAGRAAVRDIGAQEAAERPILPRGRNIVAVIGIDQYEHWPLLGNAVGDARGALARLEQLGFQQLVAPLYDERATAEAIRALIADDLRALAPEDSLILFFAGHGHVETQTFADGTLVKTGYIVPVDGDRPDESTAKWIRIDTWLSDVSRLPAHHILVILDACHSGLALGSLIKWRGGTAGSDSLDELRRRRSRRVITSALDDQLALDSGPIEGHSLFTGALLEALGDGLGRPIATGSEIGLYVQQRAREYSASKQTPDFGAFELDERGDLVVEIAPAEGAAAAAFSGD